MKRAIDLFEMNRKKERRNRFLRLAVMFLFVMAATSFGNPNNLGGMRTNITSLLGSATDIVRVLALGLLLILFIKNLFDAVGGNGGENVWWKIIGIAIIAGAIAGSQALFDMFTSFGETL